MTETDPTSSSAKDKTTIGLTRRARGVADVIQANEGLSDLLEVAMLGFAVAVNLRTGIGNAKDAVTTWNVGTFDTSGQLRDLVTALYDDLATPYRQIEYLVNVGLEKLATEYEGAEATTPLTTVLKQLS